MPWHIAKYLADTMHLTTEQHGAYLLLLAAGWMRGGQLSDDNGQLAAIARLPLKRWLTMRDTIAAFYTISAGAWRQKRQIEELEKAIALTNARSEAGKRGGRPKANDKQTESPTLANGLANNEQGVTPIPLPKPSKEDSDASASASPSDSPLDLKREIWRRGKALLGKHGVPESKSGPMLGAWRRDFGDLPVLQAMTAAEAEAPSDIVSFIAACLARNINGKRAGKPSDDTLRDNLVGPLRTAVMDRGMAAGARGSAGPAGEGEARGSRG